MIVNEYKKSIYNFVMVFFFPFSSVQMWINPCAQVIFDSDPAPKDVSSPAAVEMMSQAMIRCGGGGGESATQWVLFYFDSFLCLWISSWVFLGFFSNCVCVFLHRGMMDEEGNQFVAYFLPNEDTLRKRKRDMEEEMDYMPEELYDHTNTHQTHCVS